MIADKTVVIVTRRSHGSRKISFTKVNCLIVVKSFCNLGCKFPASRLPKSSPNAMSPMMSIVRQLNNIVMSTTPWLTCTVFRKYVLNPSI